MALRIASELAFGKAWRKSVKAPAASGAAAEVPFEVRYPVVLALMA
jgi:hypothetical protein